MSGNTGYKNEWQRKNVDRINLVVPRGDKEKIKAHAEKKKESLNGFIKRAIEETMKRESE